MDIAGKVFIVTGGASGLGEGTARMLSSLGGQVVIADMQVEKGEAVAKDIGGAFVKCDVANEADGLAVVAQAVSMGKLMGLVNCAGIAPGEKTIGKNGAHTLSTFSKCISVNLVGSFNMIRLAADAMCKNEPEATGERGVMISTASVDLHRLGSCLRRPDGPGRLQRLQGRHRRHDAADCARPGAQRHSQHDDCPRHLRHTHDVWHAARRAGLAGRRRALPLAPGHTTRLRQAGPPHF
jgi:NAD(P)-dependent dehydrogenase (short-subunit alcohol dehydrogenase family)